MPPPKFIFVRHGEAQHNVDFHVKGQAAFTDPANKDAPLTAEGIQQAKATANALETIPLILGIWSSPLTRAIQTAEEIFKETFNLSIELKLLLELFNPLAILGCNDSHNILAESIAT
jgi:broad specificity phosphatase PhoE